MQKEVIGDATLYLGDCLDVMRELPDNSVDMVVTDPPYFLPATHYSTRKAFKRRLSDLGMLEHFFSDVFAEWHRILKQDGCLYCFCDAQAYPVFYALAYPDYKRLTALVWDKGVAINGYSWRHQHELILMGERPEYPAIKTGDGDVLRDRAVGIDVRVHPAEKPTTVLRKLIAKSNKPSGVVLDCFMGSGATGEAALAEGARFIGVEAERDYFDISMARLNANGAMPSAQLCSERQDQLFAC